MAEMTPEELAQAEFIRKMNPGAKPVAPPKPAAPPLAVTPQNSGMIRDALRGSLRKREEKEGL